MSRLLPFERRAASQLATRGCQRDGLVFRWLISFAAALANATQAMNTTAGCPANTKIHLPIGKNAVGEPIWSPPFMFAGGKPQPIGRHDVAIGKTCGPGRFIFSPTSCGNLYYSPDIFEYKKTERTTGCAVHQLPKTAVGGLGCIFVEC